MTVRAKEGRDCVLINGIALEARAATAWDEGTPFEVLLSWEDAVRLRDMLSEAVGSHERRQEAGR